MDIISKTYDWKNPLTNRCETSYIVLHHRAGDGDADSIHSLHKRRGYSGIGYHFYVRKDGKVYKGRPIGAVGAHTLGANQKSIGVCFEGDFEKQQTMPFAQEKAGRELIDYLKSLYPKAKVEVHRNLQSTACPGRYFPTEKIKEGVKEMSVEDAIEIIQAKAGIEDETIEFLLCYEYGEELVRKLAEAII